MSVKIHFLNVGAGDCTIIHFPHRTRNSDGKKIDERIMMVDFCHHDNHEIYEDVINYYKRNFINFNGDPKPIFRLICTHPHHDHIKGLSHLYHSNISVNNFWDLSHNFEPSDYSGDPDHKTDWDAYKEFSGANSPSTVIRTSREDKPALYWNDDEDRISVLVPSKDLYNFAHKNEDGTKRESDQVKIDEISYMLLIQINSRKILLAGDGRCSPVWENVYEHCYDDIGDIDILKAGHHGHESAFNKDAVTRMNPKIIVFSNSESEDDENGAESKYEKVVPSASIYKTCKHGTMVFDVPFEDDKQITVTNN